MKQLMEHYSKPHTDGRIAQLFLFLDETTIATYSVSTLNGLLQPGMPGVWANNQPKENTSHAMDTNVFCQGTDWLIKLWMSSMIMCTLARSSQTPHPWSHKSSNTSAKPA